MAHPLSPGSDTDSHSSSHEVKPAVLQPAADECEYDDPLHSHAHEWHKAEQEQQQKGAKALPHPISIPRSLYTASNDPEATPTATNAFPSTPTSSSSSLHEPLKSPDDSKDSDKADSEADGLIGISRDHTAIETTPSKPQSSTEAVSLATLRTKVCKAAARGDLDTLIDLLHQGDDDSCNSSNYPSSFALVNSSTASGLTPLLEAASHGHLNIVRHLITEEGAVRDLEDTEGENAFLKASYRGHLEIMKYLAEGEDGTDVNVADREGWTALHNACSKGYLEVAMWLAENGARVDARSTQGYTVRQPIYLYLSRKSWY